MSAEELISKILKLNEDALNLVTDVESMKDALQDAHHKISIDSVGSKRFFIDQFKVTYKDDASKKYYELLKGQKVWYLYLRTSPGDRRNYEGPEEYQAYYIPLARNKCLFVWGTTYEPSKGIRTYQMETYVTKDSFNSYVMELMGDHITKYADKWTR